MLDIPRNLLPDIWTAHATLAPDKVALRCGEETLSWREFGRQMNAVGHLLRARGVRRGDRIATLMGNSIAHLVLLCGGMKYGACVTPISTLLSPTQLETLVNDSGSVLLFTDAGFAAQVDAIAARLHTLMPEGIIGDGSDGQWPDLMTLLAAAGTDDLRIVLDPDDLITISYSSGTTGTPKGVEYSHAARQNMAMTYAIAMSFKPTSRTLTTTPIYSNGTWITLWPALLTGGEITVLPSFQPETCLQAIERHAITHLFMVPTQFIRILACDALRTAVTSSVRMCITAGSTMAVELKQKVQAALGPCLYELYGFSEGGATIISPEELAVKPASVGRPNPGFDIRILGPDDQVLPRDQPGEIAFWGGWAMRGYHGKPAATAEVIWRDEAGRSFIRSGDIGRLDEDGYLYVIDRKKDMIISGGFNVFPSDIEAILMSHPDVLEATVVGVPHALWGEAPFGFLILRDASSCKPSDMLAWANGNLAKTQRLSGVLTVDEFPRNALGKVIKPALRDNAAAFLATG